MTEVRPICDEGAFNLAYGILQLAVDDYEKILLKERKWQTEEEYAKLAKERQLIEKFFNGDFCYTMIRRDGPTIIDAIEKRMDEPNYIPRWVHTQEHMNRYHREKECSFYGKE